MTVESEPEANGQLPTGLISSLTSAYADLMKRQRTASSAFVRWTRSGRRAHEFAWITERKEQLLTAGRSLRVPPSDGIYDQVRRIAGTVDLNPYEREVMYGYPYITGNVGGRPLRGPVFYMPVVISEEGNDLVVIPDDETIRFNSLIFRSEHDTEALERSLDRLIRDTPDSPVDLDSINSFCERLVRDCGVELPHRLSGNIGSAPVEPRNRIDLAVHDVAAVFVAPKTNYFVVKDLGTIGKQDPETVLETCLGNLLGAHSPQPPDDEQKPDRHYYFPFRSNPSQRRVAKLLQDDSAELIVVQGPPGTGKSLTIANVAAHLVATGKKVLITSQKDQALRVVDELLGSLELSELPMTLLRQDSDSKRELILRLEAIQQRRATAETEKELVNRVAAYDRLANRYKDVKTGLDRALTQEREAAKAARRLRQSSGMFGRTAAKISQVITSSKLKSIGGDTSDVLGDRLTATGIDSLRASSRLLSTAIEHHVGKAGRDSIRTLREVTRILGRDQRRARNFKFFDHLKDDPDRTNALLNVLPCWIMTPDDVARLFPCTPSLFDVVIIDEASQCDLPSMVPALYRAEKAIVVGDSKQMQAQRFAFTSGQVGRQAWTVHGMSDFDPEGSLHPGDSDLLRLANERSDEWVLLDEHYRSLPQIIDFSNDRWYGNRLRVMRDFDDRRIGDEDTPAVTLHQVKDGLVAVDTQENHAEADAVIALLQKKLNDPAYGDASFGVICLFEGQMQLVSELVADSIPAEIRERHDLVVVNPDGFQGDERDVVIYSLSYDGQNMPQAAISARQSSLDHVQGMLNVAFTRARDEIHIYHSAPVEQFGMASGSGAIRSWLEHCQSARSEPIQPGVIRSLDRTDSEFEAEVMLELSAEGFDVISQFPSCGFHIDLVASFEGRRIAIECDGEYWHYDEYGELSIEDVERQEILERAGWNVLRIPYRAWGDDPQRQVKRVIDGLMPPESSVATEVEQEDSDVPNYGKTRYVTGPEQALLAAIAEDIHEIDEVYRKARESLGYKRLGSVIRQNFALAIAQLELKKLIHIENGQLFLTAEARNIDFGRSTSGHRPYHQAPAYRRRRGRRW